MAKDSHITAPTRFVEAGGIRYAYRRFGAESGTPLVFLQHFRGGLDNWDPLVTDGLAQGRPVILFNNAGVEFGPQHVGGEAFAPRSFFRNQGREFSGALLRPLAQSLFLARVPIAPAPRPF
jgi:pimeloyl-ACP methyl ester carboxylesterase